MLQLRNEISAFQVDEIPKYQASGQGYYLWLQVRKTNLHTDSLCRIFAQALNINAKHVAYAGKKDKLAVSTQWLSVPAAAYASAPIPVSGEQFGGSWEILSQAQHDVPMRLGFLLGNRFTIVLHDTAAENIDESVLQQCCQRLQDETILNVFGQQRFGYERKNLLAVRAWAEGRYQDCIDILLQDAKGDLGLLRRLAELVGRSDQSLNAQQQLNRMGKPAWQFFASVAQSAVFNAIAEARFQAGYAQTVREGDLLLRKGKSAFHARADELDELQADLNAGLVSCTAPLPGFKLRQPSPAIAAEELAWAVAAQIPFSVFAKKGCFASPGERRRIIMSIEAATYNHAAQSISFTLASGSYASVVLEHLGIAFRAQQAFTE